MSDTKAGQAGWSEDVKPIGYDGIARLGVGRDDQLYWDGRPVETRQVLKFSLWQNALAFAVSLAAIVGGLNAAVDFGCKLYWWSTVCSK